MRLQVNPYPIERKLISGALNSISDRNVLFIYEIILIIVIQEYKLREVGTEARSLNAKVNMRFYQMTRIVIILPWPNGLYFKCTR